MFNKMPYPTFGCRLSDIETRRKLADDLGAILDTKELADVTIITGDGHKIPVHKLILSARSKVFAAMFKHSMKESAENCVTIPDLSYEVAMEMLRFIYTGKASNLKEISIDLIAAAEKYGLEDLKEMCANSMSDNLSIETAPIALKKADLYNMEDLKNRAIQFIKRNIGSVNKTSNWSDFLMTDRKLILESFIDPMFLQCKRNNESNENVKSAKK